MDIEVIKANVAECMKNVIEGMPVAGYPPIENLFVLDDESNFGEPEAKLPSHEPFILYIKMQDASDAVLFFCELTMEADPTSGKSFEDMFGIIRGTVDSKSLDYGSIQLLDKKEIAVAGSIFSSTANEDLAYKQTIQMSASTLPRIFNAQFVKA